MRSQVFHWQSNKGWSTPLESSTLQNNANLLLVFGQRQIFEQNDVLSYIQNQFPQALMIGGSTAGEINGINVHDNSLVVTALQFEKTPFKAVHQMVTQTEDSYSTGVDIAKQLIQEDLKYVLIFSDGLVVNGTELVRGLNDVLPTHIPVTGGLMGDYTEFSKTYVLTENGLQDKHIVAVGFYGDHIRIGFGSMGGWDAYGLVRRITRSTGNVLFEMDGKPALDTYKLYLGERANELPYAGLLFPLNIRMKLEDYPVVRTVVGVDESKQALIFAGAVPEGAYAQFMKANFNRLVDGAFMAATTCCKNLSTEKWDYALLISCIGRKLVLNQRIEEEIEAVHQVLGKNTMISGFYSYGEICPIQENTRCELHNQSMTLTTFLEV